MTEFKTWTDSFTIFGLGDGLAKSVPGWLHYSIDGVEVSKAEFEKATAITPLKKSAKLIMSGCMACAFQNKPYHAFGTPCPSPASTKSMMGHHLGIVGSHNWVYLLETDQAKCSCGLTESAYVFETTRGMKVNDLPFADDAPTLDAVPCLPCLASGRPDHLIGAYCPTRAKQADVIDWARM